MIKCECGNQDQDTMAVDGLYSVECLVCGRKRELTPDEIMDLVEPGVRFIMDERMG